MKLIFNTREKKRYYGAVNRSLKFTYKFQSSALSYCHIVFIASPLKIFAPLECTQNLDAIPFLTIFYCIERTSIQHGSLWLEISSQSMWVLEISFVCLYLSFTLFPLFSVVWEAEPDSLLNGALVPWLPIGIRRWEPLAETQKTGEEWSLGVFSPELIAVWPRVSRSPLGDFSGFWKLLCPFSAKGSSAPWCCSSKCMTPPMHFPSLCSSLTSVSCLRLTRLFKWSLNWRNIYKWLC